MPRLFSAIEVPCEATQSIRSLCNGLLGARWIDDFDYHITLNFLGDIEDHLADRLILAYDKVDFEPFTVRLKSANVFGSKKPHSIYVAIEPNAALNALHKDLQNIAVQLGVLIDKRPFIPHITIARLKAVNAQELANYLSLCLSFTAKPIVVNRFVLMSAKASKGGGPYIIEKTWSVKKADKPAF